MIQRKHRSQQRLKLTGNPAFNFRLLQFTIYLFLSSSSSSPHPCLHAIMQTEPSNLPLRCLRKINQYFRHLPSQSSYSVDPQNHKLDRRHGIIKNFMRLTNKTLIGINRFRINRAAIFSGVLGVLMGFICSQLDDSIATVLKSYRPAIKSVLINQVLRNIDIKLKLNQALLDNVYTNPDIQYNLGQILISKAILPQQSDLFVLSKLGILQALESQALIKAASRSTAQALLDYAGTIGHLSLQFLGGSTMQKIVREEVSSLLSRQDINEEIAWQLKRLLRQQLNAQGTRQTLYTIIREKFISW